MHLCQVFRRRGPPGAQLHAVQFSKWLLRLRQRLGLEREGLLQDPCRRQHDSLRDPGEHPEQVQGVEHALTVHLLLPGQEGRQQEVSAGGLRQPALQVSYCHRQPKLRNEDTRLRTPAEQVPRRLPLRAV